jgi:hypothetical protein
MWFRIVLPIILSLLAGTGPSPEAIARPSTLSSSTTHLSPSQLERFLADVVNDPIVSNDSLLGKPRVIVDENAATLELHLEPIPARYLLNEGSPLNTALEADIRLSILRRDLASAFSEQSWTPAFGTIDEAIRACVETEVNSTDQKKHATNEDPCPAIGAGFAQLGTQIEHEAKQRHLDVIETRGGVTPFPIRMSFVPRKVPLKIMTALQYRECQVLHQPMQGEFNDVVQDPVYLIGRYHYRVEWPAELGGPQEGDFEIKSGGTLRFTAVGR